MLAAGDTFPTDLLAPVLLVPLGTALGSLARDRVVHMFRARADRADLGVLAANLVACAVVGVFASAASTLHALVVIGFAGGLSTWSSLAVEVAGAIRARRWSLVLLHVPAAFAMALGVYIAARALAGGAP